MTFTTKVTSVLSGYVDYATYATFCMAAFALVLFARDRAWPDLATFAAALCLCVTTKSTALLGCGLLVAASVPLLARRTGYGRALLAAGLLTAVIGASPFLTSWIQYGSPVYPYQTFDPKAVTFDMTGDDFAFNADAAGMGRLARLCYAWLSPGLTVAAIRLLTGNPGFSPSFSGCGGAEVSGPGLWFNALLLASFLLLAASPKNRVTGLCAVIFATACLVPLNVIGYARYVPQLWMIFPLAVLNFASAPGNAAAGRRLRLLRRAVVVLSAAVLAALAGLSLLRTLAFQGRMLVEERLRQNLIASFPADRPVRVSAGGYRFTNVQRFRQAGRTLVKAADGEADTVLEPETALPRFDTHPEIRADLDARFPLCNGVRSLFVTFRWADVFRNLPRPLRQ